MRPELETQENLKWSVRLCLTVPPAAPPLLPIGQPGKIYGLCKARLSMKYSRMLRRYLFW